MVNRVSLAPNLRHGGEQGKRTTLLGVRGMKASCALLCWVAIGFFGCLTASRVGAATEVHIGDQLAVTVYDHPELSRRVVVDADNTLSLPVGGTVNVAGLDTAQIATRIERALDPYVNTPEVGVELLGRAPTLQIRGGPGGVIAYQSGENLIAALAALAPAANGSNKLTGLAALEHSRVDLHRVGILRDDRVLGTFDAIDLWSHGQGGPLMQPGDTLVLNDKPVLVQVQGAVAFPGAVHISVDQPLSDAIEQAGGVLPTAASAQIRLQRDGATQTIALGEALLREPAHSGDVLIVPTAPRVSVDGYVDKPGPVTLGTNFSLLNALYAAGGPTRRGDLAHVLVVHDGVSNYYDLSNVSHGAPTQNVTLADGDLVFVPETRKFDYTVLFQTLLPFAFFIPKV